MYLTLSSSCHFSCWRSATREIRSTVSSLTLTLNDESGLGSCKIMMEKITLVLQGITNYRLQITLVLQKYKTTVHVQYTISVYGKRVTSLRTLSFVTMQAIFNFFWNKLFLRSVNMNMDTLIMDNDHRLLADLS